MKISRREKISYGCINKKRYQFIPDKDCAKSNERIRNFMRPFIKKQKYREAISQRSASRVIFNA